MFRPVDPKTPPAEVEHKYLEYWKRKNIFERSVQQREGKPKYVFFDGPPFANGLPHYGHIMANALKDAVTRYFTMRGFYVPRANGWDCHGLPVEYEVEKDLELKGRKDIEELGIEKFNTKCRESVFRYTQQWEGLLDRIGRWVDTENGYATLNATYMESIWWVFKQIWEKDMVYRGHKAMHICPRCVTPLSNFEVTQGYQDVTDLSVVAKFRSKDDPNLYFLAWTTTPWTLSGNAALAVAADVDYLRVTHNGHSYILAKDLLEKHFELDGLTIEEEMKGKDLVGMRYEPLFPYYENADLEGIENAWQVIAEDFVTTEDGTGIVHIAGGYGEDDMRAVQEHNIPIIQHVAMDGTFKPEVTDFAGKFVKGQDQNVAEYLDKAGLLFSKENYRHSYPHCWRCDTPLLNYATDAWFVRVTDIKDRLMANNEKIHWQPAHIKDGRFGKWLENVKDWNISRNRFWGCPIPVWTCGECEHMECIGSVDQLKERSGGKLPMREGELDLHKPYIDEITMPCSKCTGTMQRIPEVLDCWFESGSMPYAQLHYPFENKEEFEQNFPANFIAEGLDQTRGWFYTLHVLSTILFDEPAFKNVIVNGILLAADGEKLSKRKKNYPDPNELFDEKGVDTTRMFLYSSTAPLAEDVRFSEQHVDDLLKKFTLTLWNTYSFFVTYANIDGFEPKENMWTPSHKLDQWMLSELNALTKEVTQQMEDYNLTRATRPIITFVDNLSNWYVRRSRRRFWKSENDSDKNEAYQTLHTVLTQLAKLLAPFMPFLADEIYRNLTNEESVHLADWPEADESLIDEALNQDIERTRLIVNLGHAVRAKKKIRVRQPLEHAELWLPGSMIHDPISEDQLQIIKEELNVETIKPPHYELGSTGGAEGDQSTPGKIIVKAKSKILGPKYGSGFKEILQKLRDEKFSVDILGTTGQVFVELNSEKISLSFPEEVDVTVDSVEDCQSQNGISVKLNCIITDELRQKGMMREVVRYIQEMRKDAGYEVSDRILILAETEGELEAAITEFADTIKAETLANELQQGGDLEWDAEKDFEIEGIKVKLAVKKANS